VHCLINWQITEAVQQVNSWYRTSFLL